MQNEGAVSGTDHDSASVRRLEFDVDWPPGHVAAYLIEDDEPILVDAGDPGTDNEAKLERSLAAVGYELSDVDHVVVTHPHIDHVGLLPQLLEAGSPTVYAPISYRDSLQRSDDSLRSSVETTARRIGLPDSAIETVVDRALERSTEIQACLPEEAVDVWLPLDHTVDVGGRTFETIHTPGHQRDHLCLSSEIDGEDVLFSGDMVIEPFRAAAVHANLDAEQADAIEAYYDSLDRLQSRSFDRVYPGHGPVHHAYHEAIKTARESLDRLVERTEAAVRETGTHAGHAARSRSDAAGEGPWLPEAVGALAYLEREGRLESYLEDDVRYYVPA